MGDLGRFGDLCGGDFAICSAQQRGGTAYRNDVRLHNWLINYPLYWRQCEAIARYCQILRLSVAFKSRFLIRFLHDYLRWRAGPRITRDGCTVSTT